MYAGYEDDATGAAESEAWRNFCHPGTILMASRRGWRNKFLASRIESRCRSFIEASMSSMGLNNARNEYFTKKSM